jgi:hypothetical protein
MFLSIGHATGTPLGESDALGRPTEPEGAATAGHVGPMTYPPFEEAWVGVDGAVAVSGSGRGGRSGGATPGDATRLARAWLGRPGLRCTRTASVWKLGGGRPVRSGGSRAGTLVRWTTSPMQLEGLRRKARQRLVSMVAQGGATSARR